MIADELSHNLVRIEWRPDMGRWAAAIHASGVSWGGFGSTPFGALADLVMVLARQGTGDPDWKPSKKVRLTPKKK